MLQIADHLHGAQLGGAGDRASGEGRRYHIGDGQARAQARFDPCHQVMDVGQVHDARRVGNAHAAGYRDAAKIVAHQIDDHRQFGAVFDAGEQCGAGL